LVNSIAAVIQPGPGVIHCLVLTKQTALSSICVPSIIHNNKHGLLLTIIQQAHAATA
jgi:hypothetical protein